MTGQKDEMVESGYFDQNEQDDEFDMEAAEQAMKYDHMYDPFLCGDF